MLYWHQDYTKKLVYFYKDTDCKNKLATTTLDSMRQIGFIICVDHKKIKYNKLLQHLFDSL